MVLATQSSALLVLAFGPRTAHSCESNVDCQLNGLCVNGACECDEAWDGQDCGKLALEIGSIAYGCYPSDPLECDYSSWGGGPPVLDAESGKWVFYVTEMAAHCGLSEWNTMSTCVKAVGDSPAGPFVHEKVAVGMECHNPYYVQDPVTEVHLLFHMFTGRRSPSQKKRYRDDCTNGTTPSSDTGESIAVKQHSLKEDPIPNGSPEIHMATSLNGTFERVSVSGVGPIQPGQYQRGAANIAPFIFPNGTVLVLYKINFTIWAMRAPRYDGPYEVIGEIFHPVGEPVFNDSSMTHVRQEDPTIWRDRRGNFHNLDHGKHGHGFSEDGITWHWSGPPEKGGPPGGHPAYSNADLAVKLKNGSVVECPDAERLRVWVNPGTGLPELLFYASGGSHQPVTRDGTARGFTVVQKIRTERPGSVLV